MESFENLGLVPIDSTLAHNIFRDYKSPKDKVRRMEKSGAFLRLKKGLFVVSPGISKLEISLELIANHLYGPSYVSFESALSFHGLIPERVYTIKSATTKRFKSYATPLGNFEYITVPTKYYPVGLKMMVKNSYAFILASPEKAICDLILSTSGLRFQSKKAIRVYLQDDLRIDIESRKKWDTQVIKECIQFAYKKTELQLLLNLIENEYCI